MKTLDEVIKGFECCQEINCAECPYANWDNTDVVHCNDTKKEDDALHYLKELKDILDPLKVKKNSHEITCPQCNSVIAILLPESNPPLGWDELKTMEGKPVWVESHGDIAEFTGWAIVRNALEDRVHFILSHDDGEFLTYEMALPDVTFGKRWQAYRKERTE